MDSGSMDINNFLMTPPIHGPFQQATLPHHSTTHGGHPGMDDRRQSYTDSGQEDQQGQEGLTSVGGRSTYAFGHSLGYDGIGEGGFDAHDSTQASPVKFDPNDYGAQGLDESAFSSVIPFKMPNFLMSGPAGDFGDGPAVLEPPSAPMQQISQSAPADRSMFDTQPHDSGPGPPSGQTNNFNANSGSPVFGMYGSSVVGVNADSRPFKKVRNDNDESYLQGTGANVRRGSSGSRETSSGSSSEEPFDASHLGLPPPAGGNFPGLYSSSGFDLLGVLARVVARPNPTINVGPVDTSASFVVCDARRYDFPIVFASKTFSHLTGYDTSEILGRNCRFLQSPAGVVEKGSKRKDTDGRAVRHLQKHIESAKECQASLINYRKNGEPFINLITIIPITWDSDEITYFVGFQVNLIEQPNAILDRMKNGTYVINYTLLAEPPGGFEPAREVQPDPDQIAYERRDDKRQKAQLASSNAALDQLGDRLAEDSDPKKHWFETLIEQCDDMIHVLSLKGSLLYVSPAVERTLGYTPGELAGKNLHTICHPSDWIAVMRELKESSNGDNPNVHLLYRVRHKMGNFVWIEAQGRLYNENGKGRKCVILLARERPIYRLSWTELHANGGLGDDEVWYKVSLDGTYLYVGPTIQRVFGFEPSSMIGSTIKQTLPDDHHSDFLRLISKAANGRKGSLHHHMLDRSRKPIEVVTHFWPSKPVSKRDGSFADEMPETNFVVCQTNQIKSELKRMKSAREFTGRSRPTPSSQSSYSGTPALITREVQPQSTNPNGHSFAPQAPTFSAVPSTYKCLRGHPAARRDNVFNDLDTAHSSSWLYEIHLLENLNKKLAEERDALLAARSRRKRTFSDFQSGQSSSSDSPPQGRACANCGKMNSPEWRRGPGGLKSLCNACGLRWSKAQNHSNSSSSGSGSAQPESSCSESRISSSGSVNSRSDSPAAALAQPLRYPQLRPQLSTGAMPQHSISPSSSTMEAYSSSMPLNGGFSMNLQ